MIALWTLEAVYNMTHQLINLRNFACFLQLFPELDLYHVVLSLQLLILSCCCYFMLLANSCVLSSTPNGLTWSHAAVSGTLSAKWMCCVSKSISNSTPEIFSLKHVFRVA
jgi:hypothetical protein